MKSCHLMTFGAEPVPAGVRFRLWAPGARRVAVKAVVRGDEQLQVDMSPRAGGWYECLLRGMGAGIRYWYRFDDEIDVPDPASRFNPEGVEAAAEVIDPRGFERSDDEWRGREWHEAVLYEMHIGTFTCEGTYAAAAARLGELAKLGITAIELMPVAAFPGRRGIVAQWNDDFHHALHVIMTGERDGYYADDPVARLGRVLAEGFAYQGEYSRFAGAPRGERSADLPPVAFVNFLQNHDQVGNRALGERLAALSLPQVRRAALAMLILSPQIPMLSMGQEYAATQPFLFFCDYQGDLAQAIREGRRKEFAAFTAFADEEQRAIIPDPNDEATFLASRLDSADQARSPHAQWLSYVRELLQVRANRLMPLLPEMLPGQASYTVQGRVLTVQWPTRSGSTLVMYANLDDAPAEPPVPVEGELLFSSTPDGDTGLAPWDVRLLLAHP